MREEILYRYPWVDFHFSCCEVGRVSLFVCGFQRLESNYYVIQIGYLE